MKWYGIIALLVLLGGLVGIVYVGANLDKFSNSFMSNDVEDPEKFYSETFSKFYRLALQAEQSGKKYVDGYYLDENYKNDPDVIKFQKFFHSKEYKKACQNAYEILSEEDSDDQSLHQRWYSNLSCEANQETWNDYNPG